jgi:DTW domain-containing protein
MTTESSNQYLHLRKRKLAEATREFRARGKSVMRCERCQLAVFACLCSCRAATKSRCEFIVLMHSDEIFKPTNTGRLIADILPLQTHVFCWSRTEPDRELLNLLGDSNRSCFLVFPVNEKDPAWQNAIAAEKISSNEKITTFILFDGTWKQARKMFHCSRWLEGIPSVILPNDLASHYQMRKAHQEDYLSTAEAAVLCLRAQKDREPADVLLNYFMQFNKNYLLTRGRGSTSSP